MADFNLVDKFNKLADALERITQNAKDAADASAKASNKAERAAAKMAKDEVQKERIQKEKELNKQLKERERLQKRAEKEADKITQSLDVELQTKRELLKINQKLVREEAKRLADQKKFGKVQKGSIDDLKRQQKELTILRNRVNQNTTAYKKYTDRLREVNQQLRKTGEAVKDNRGNVGNYTGALNKGINSLKNYAKGLLGIAAAFAAIRRIASAAQEYINLAREQILQEQKLSTILKERTKATDDQVKSVIDLTKAQQALGVVGDEVQIAGAQQFATFVKSTDSVKTLIPALNNLIVQQKGVNASTQDAVTIANLAGRAFQGQLGALTRVGISFDEAQGKILKYGTESEKAAALAEIITQNVGELNKELAKTDIGRIQQLNNEIGDIKEEIGKELIPIMRVFKSISVGTFKEILDITKDLTEPIRLIKEIRDSIESTNDRLDKSKERFQEAAKAIKNLINPIRALIKWNAILFKGLRSVLQALNIIDSESEKRFKNVQQRTKDLQKEFAGLSDTLKSRVIGDFRRLTKEFQSGKLSPTEYADALNQLILSARVLASDGEGGISNVTKEVKQLNDEIERVVQLTGSLRGESPLANIFDRESGEDLRLTAQLEDEISRIPEVVSRLGESLRGANIFQKIFGFFKTDEGKPIAEGLKTGFSLLFESITEGVEESLNRIDQLISRQDEAIQNTTSQLEAEKNRIQELKLAGAAFDTNEQTRLQKRLAIEQQTKNKLLAEEKKFRQQQNRLKLVEASTQVALNVIKAYGTPPVPNFIAAGIAAALGAVQLATIASAKFEEGGFVGGKRHKQGGTIIEAERDEFVVKRKSALKSKSLLNMINTGLVNDDNFTYYGGTAIIDMGTTNNILTDIKSNTEKTEGILPDGSTWYKRGRSTIYRNKVS